jgi:tetratricopeptide (TPR) repeat protein
LNSMGITLVHIGQYNKAMTVYEKALEFYRNKKLTTEATRLRANVAELLLISHQYSQAESVATEVKYAMNELPYKIIMQYLITCSLYLRGLTDKGKESALDLLALFESFDVSQNIEWSLDDLKAVIFSSSLSDKVRSLLLSLIEVMGNEITEKDEKNKQLQTIKELLR